MIELNKHKFNFVVASGALGFDGDGWWFEQPSRWLGILRPEEFVIITKTLTYWRRRGQLEWWCPWRSVRFVEDGVVNNVSLTNYGYWYWINNYYRKILKRKYRVIPSIMPMREDEAAYMIRDFNRLSGIVALEFNASCPNIDKNYDVCELVKVMLKESKHPIIVKLSYQDDYLRICKELDGKVAAFDLINSVPFRTVFPDKTSPLAKYGFLGGVSGSPIKRYAREALKNVKEAGIKTPIISGGAIDSLDEVLIRKALGADAFAFGTIFMKKPWLPNMIVKQLDYIR